MKAFNEKLIAEFRANGGTLVSGPMAGSKPMLLTTTGARSGSPRTVVIGYRADGDRLLAIASNNGNDVAPHWYRNLRQNPAAVVELGTDRFDVHARTADPGERRSLAPKIDYLERQQALTKREIPIVIFERA
ncbi:MAG TPA: nitroreductase/quinone reductase family protein [Candidatus Dormibacteraeota bacterium]|nr:nitroreductase/quinone reductase family protein [Candidatus Dormibacteraeota bacterium]